jgi:hydroxymethylglutaryl-CoA reductase (NADPH)
MKIPENLLAQLYTGGSLRTAGSSTRFEIKNRLLDARVIRLAGVRVDHEEVPLASVRVLVEGGPTLAAADVARDGGLAFPMRRKLQVYLEGVRLGQGRHLVELELEEAVNGAMTIAFEDSVHPEEEPRRQRIPHDDRADLSDDLVRARRRFVAEMTGVTLEHVAQFSFDPANVRGNIENFTGVAQVPLGFAGPIHIDGEHARGDFLVPMATTEGTLVASYNRGIKVVNAAGGALCTISDDAMQRAPVFVFDSARGARDFTRWIEDNTPAIRVAAEATSSVAKLTRIHPYLSNKFAFLRFNYTTGDAAGQNMVGRATFAACQWILDHATGVRRFYLEANLATDKKHSHVNVMHTRGKRVTAEVTVSRALLAQHLRVTPEQLHAHASVGTVGALLSGATNNGAHSPNGIAAMFIATGQDVANLAESSAAILYSELTPDGGLYVSLTIPSLIVATHGGGTGLPTQQECLRVLGCTGRGTVGKLAEIMAGVALAGELSLGAAISALDWVSSHEQMGRHR